MPQPALQARDQRDSSSPRAGRLILVTGATGYVGGLLVPLLLRLGYRVRCLARDPSRLSGRSWRADVEVVAGDVTDPEALRPALAGVDVAFYLVHSMTGHGDFRTRDVAAARVFGAAAARADVSQIVYLGGLGDPAADLSEHLRSRQETGAALGESGVPVTELRAAIVVGGGSISFEMIRYLTERLPVMICPRWVYTRVQPIAVRDVLRYLIAAIEVPAATGRVIEIGGADVLTYGEMMLGYARERGLRRRLVAVPVLTPTLSSWWVHLVTPIPDTIARPLIQGLRNEVVVRDPLARQLFPEIEPMPYAEAVRRALANVQSRSVETRWADALASSRPPGSPPEELTLTAPSLSRQRRRVVVAAPQEVVWSVIAGLGGERGWLYWDWVWRLRGAADRLAGGVGLRRGRRDPDDLRVGDALDFWRVEAVDPPRLLRLRAEMLVPGAAWLQFETEPLRNGCTRIVQTAFFAPKGLGGLAYWYGLYPAHAVLFTGMIRALAATAAEKAHASQL